MSTAKKIFCNRMAAIRIAIDDFKLQDLPATSPANISHNSSARIIRNGLAVQCFNVFENFVKGRMAEVLIDIGNSKTSFAFLPEEFQRATTADVIKAIDFQLKNQDKANRISFAQDYSEKISSTKATNIRFAEISFFHSASNISKDHFRNSLSAFAVDRPWDEISRFASRVGISALPAESIFFGLAQRRHDAAHNANASISETDLQQSIKDAITLGLCFDVLLSRSTQHLTVLKSSLPAKSTIINSTTYIPLRFIKHAGKLFGEIKEGAKKYLRKNKNQSIIIAGATKRAFKEKGVVIIFDVHGIPADWIV